MPKSKNLFKVGLFLCVLWIALYTLAVIIKFDYSWAFYPIWIAISFLFYWIGYKGLYQFKLAKDRKSVKILLDKISKYKGLEVKEKNEYTQNNPIFIKLKELIEEENIYRHQNLTLYKLSKKLNTNTSTLSKLINQISSKNFNDFINFYRINEAKKILSTPHFNEYKISAIGYEVGFSNSNTFYISFKKGTGLTPGKYRDYAMKINNP